MKLPSQVAIGELALIKSERSTVDVVPDVAASCAQKSAIAGGSGLRPLRLSYSKLTERTASVGYNIR